MHEFRCDKCGAVFYDDCNFAVCSCFGLGRVDPRCTCGHLRTGMGIKLNVIKRDDPNCPVHHGDAVTPPATK